MTGCSARPGTCNGTPVSDTTRPRACRSETGGPSDQLRFLPQADDGVGCPIRRALKRSRGGPSRHPGSAVSPGASACKREQVGDRRLLIATRSS
jgi:hypothetical protein